MDYYDVLGVSKSADADEIEAAYRERSKRRHPDVADDRHASQLFKHLQSAKEVLSNRKERTRYDRLGHDEYVTKYGGYARAELEPFYSDDSGTDTTSSADTAEKGQQHVVPREEREGRRENDSQARERDSSSTKTGTTSDRTTTSEDASPEPTLRDRYENHVTRAGYLVFASVASFTVMVAVIAINETGSFVGSLESLPLFLPTLVGYVFLIAVAVSLLLAGAAILYLVGLSGVRIYLAVAE